MPEHITRRHLIGATGALGVANLIQQPAELMTRLRQSAAV